jgi:putative tryptophan/tyrosine transport system substrate-binding protein
VRRRRLIQLIGTAAGALAVAALPRRTALGQQPPKVPKVGYLYPGPESGLPPRIAALRAGLGRSGVREAEVTVVARASDGDGTRLRSLAAELVRSDVDMVVTVSPAALREVLALTERMPIVAHDLETDPVASGFVKSFSRPGLNVTGLFLDIPSLSAKWLELLRELLPGLGRVVAF